jgi:hypothetical protein
VTPTSSNATLTPASTLSIERVPIIDVSHTNSHNSFDSEFRTGLISSSFSLGREQWSALLSPPVRPPSWTPGIAELLVVSAAMSLVPEKVAPEVAARPPERD